MKRKIFLIIILSSCTLVVCGQRLQDSIFLKNGSFIFGRLIEIKENKYNLKTSDGSLFVIPADDIERFVLSGTKYGKKTGRPEGLGFSIQCSILTGSMDYSGESILYPEDQRVNLFSITPLITYTFNDFISLSAGTGLEFYDTPVVPLFAEFKINMVRKRYTPFCYGRAGGIFFLFQERFGDHPNEYNPGWSYGAGLGLSLPLGRREYHLQFGYRYANTSYLHREYRGTPSHYQMIEYVKEFDLFDLTIGFKF